MNEFFLSLSSSSPILCTACGEKISIEKHSYYKCHECKLHYVCKKCSNGQQIHNLKKIKRANNQVKDSGETLASPNLPAPSVRSDFCHFSQDLSSHNNLIVVTRFVLF